MEIQGTIKQIFEENQVTASFKKREFVLGTGGEYPQEILIQMTQDKCSLLDKFKVGGEVTVHININGRAWQNPQGETKYFNSIVGWKIDGEGSQSSTVAVGSNDEEDLDLPF